MAEELQLQPSDPKLAPWNVVIDGDIATFQSTTSPESFRVSREDSA